MRGDYVTSHFEAPCASAGSFGAWPRRPAGFVSGPDGGSGAPDEYIATWPPAPPGAMPWPIGRSATISRFVTFSSFECSVAYGQRAG
jgi:hypothetical protein